VAEEAGAAAEAASGIAHRMAAAVAPQWVSEGAGRLRPALRTAVLQQLHHTASCTTLQAASHCKLHHTAPQCCSSCTTVGE
jgi:hypothetical protein